MTERNRRHFTAVRHARVMTIGRRELLGGVSLATVGLSGCFGVGLGSGTTDIYISNEVTEERTATIRVTERSDGTELLGETFSIDPDATKEYDEVVSGVHVDVRLAVEDDPEKTYEWSDGESDAQSLHIDIAADSITFSESSE